MTGSWEKRACFEDRWIIRLNSKAPSGMNSYIHEKFIKILDSICEVKDRIYGGCEDLYETNSIFEKLSNAKEKYIECVESRKKKKLENHKKKFYERHQGVKTTKRTLKIKNKGFQQ